MSNFKLDSNTLVLLKAQARLTDTFNHTIRGARGEKVRFTLSVEHTRVETQFVVKMGGEHHSLTLPNTSSIHLKLAAFIRDIATSLVTSAQHPKLSQPSDTGRYLADDNLSLKVLNLIRRGGAAHLYVGLQLPIHVAVHRNRTRNAVTTVMSIGVKRPRTKCFTVMGSDAEMHAQVVESINHLISVASPAAQAA